MIILSGSPRHGGNSDRAAALLCEGLAEGGLLAQIRTVREGVIRPCVACGFCESHAGRCALDTPGDDTATLLAALREAKALVLVLPVYFYGPPAQCKALVDRAQKCWWSQSKEEAKEEAHPLRPLFMVQIAARSEGQKLFEANGLIGRCFAKCLGFAPLPVEKEGVMPPRELCLRGLDGRDALDHDSARSAEVRAFGREMAAALGRP